MRRLVMTYLASAVTGSWRFDRHLASSICEGRTLYVRHLILPTR